MNMRMSCFAVPILMLLVSSSMILPTYAQGPRVFQDVKLLVPSGKKSRPVDATLCFTQDQLVIRSRDEGEDLRVFPYTAIKRAYYSYSKHPRWKAGIGAAVAVGVFATPLFFMKSKRHWLTVQTKDEYAVLRLHKNNYLEIRAALETRTGVRIETIPEGR